MVECINMIQDTGGTRPGMQGPRQSQHGIDSMYTETKQFKLQFTRSYRNFCVYDAQLEAVFACLQEFRSLREKALADSRQSPRRIGLEEI